MASSTCMKVLQEVTVCMYKQGDEKFAVKWSFLTKIVESNLSSFLRYLKSCGLDDRSKGNRRFEIRNKIVIQVIDGGNRISSRKDICYRY